MDRPLVHARGYIAAATLILLSLRASAADVAFTLTETKGNKPVADAVVSLVPLDANTARPAQATSPANAEVEQKNEEFVPYVTAVRVGTTVSLPNRERKVEHHVYSESPAKTFELPLYKAGKAESVLFDKPGVVAIGCNIHDWMLAYVVVLDTPWFAVTPDGGKAVIRDVPPGRYRAEVWHPRLRAVASREIVVGDATPEPAAFALALKPDRRIRRGPEIGGRGYR